MLYDVTNSASLVTLRYIATHPFDSNATFFSISYSFFSISYSSNSCFQVEHMLNDRLLQFVDIDLHDVKVRQLLPVSPNMSFFLLLSTVLMCSVEKKKK